MRKVWRVVLALALVLPFAVVLNADIEDARIKMQAALTQVETYGYKLPDGGRGSSWFAWNLYPSTYVQVDRTFYRGNSYVLVAAGDGRVRDVDIKVYDENWNVIASDTDETALAVVRFAPRWTGAFHVRTIYYAGAPVGSVGFFIAYR